MIVSNPGAKEFRGAEELTLYGINEGFIR
jgi:hypothetical protein